ncbi:MAG: hypothetical protein IPK84_00985 [Candidatus Moraniibacteriota bacterium]|nr:MAG: hypothetical protein IPK84_00985 [Candidatus Moranbacteria bacterium]
MSTNLILTIACILLFTTSILGYLLYTAKKENKRLFEAMLKLTKICGLKVLPCPDIGTLQRKIARLEDLSDL